MPTDPKTTGWSGAPSTRTANDFLSDVTSRQSGGGVDVHVSRASGALEGLTSELFRLGEENDRRFAEGSGVMKDAVGALKPTFSDQDFRELYANEADRSAADFEDNIGLISESLGIRGVSGGLAADLAMANHAQFQKSLANAKGNLRVAKIQSDAQDAMRNLNASFTLGNFLASPADESRAAGISAFVEGSFSLAGITSQIKAQNDAKKQADKAMWMSLGSSVLGAAGAAL